MPLLSPSKKTPRLTLSCPDSDPSTSVDNELRQVATRWHASAAGRCLFRRGVLSRLRQIERGRLIVSERAGSLRFGPADSTCLTGEIHVRDRRFFRQIVLGGGLGAAEAYIRGYWDAPNLVATMRVLAQNMHVLSRVERGVPRLLRPLRTATNWMRRNTRAGSRRNIAAHYDLSNEFFELMLDSTMTYSAGIFPSTESTLEQASTEKYDRICRKLQLKPDDHVLEIGTGWGGFAAHAVQHYGCRVTTTTISAKQRQYAAKRFDALPSGDRIELLSRDYRDLTGQYDKLVSIEMIEAVGEKFLPNYFRKCSELLKPGGEMCLQSITMPDCRFANYRRSVDFIQRYIFPGGFLPSIGRIADCVGRKTDMQLMQVEDFALHYAETLAHWRRNFESRIEEIQQLGFDERFIRLWRYYLAYCEAGFRERQVGVAHIVLAKAE